MLISMDNMLPDKWNCMLINHPFYWLRVSTKLKSFPLSISIWYNQIIKLILMPRCGRYANVWAELRRNRIDQKTWCWNIGAWIQQRMGTSWWQTIPKSRLSTLEFTIEKSFTNIFFSLHPFFFATIFY